MTDSNPLKSYAEDILKRYDEEEFDIDGQRAETQSSREAVNISLMKDEGGGYGGQTDLATMFTNTVTDFRMHHEDISQSRRVEIRLTNAYDLLRNHACIVDGRGTKRRIAQRDEQIKDIQQRLEDTTKKLGVMEQRLSECADEKIGLENTVKEQKERLDNIRSEDIKHSLGSTTSKTEEDDEQ